jgi:hypothetical protein
MPDNPQIPFKKIFPELFVFSGLQQHHKAFIGKFFEKRARGERREGEGERREARGERREGKGERGKGKEKGREAKMGEQFCISEFLYNFAPQFRTLAERNFLGVPALQAEIIPSNLIRSVPA